MNRFAANCSAELLHKSGETYPSAILLGPRIIAIDSRLGFPPTICPIVAARNSINSRGKLTPMLLRERQIGEPVAELIDPAV
jgi:hypothetical protein